MPGSWNRYAYVEGDPVNHNDTSGLMAEALEPLVTFSTTVTARPTGGDIPGDVLFAVLQRGTPRNLGIRTRQSDIWEDMFDISANALGQYAGAFAKQLRRGGLSEDCAKDIATLGIGADALADTLDDLSIQMGPGSKEPYGGTSGGFDRTSHSAATKFDNRKQL